MQSGVLSAEAPTGSYCVTVQQASVRLCVRIRGTRSAAVSVTLAGFAVRLLPFCFVSPFLHHPDTLRQGAVGILAALFVLR